MEREEPEAEEVQKYCDRCGREALGELGDEVLCESCYHGETACCGRFCDDE